MKTHKMSKREEVLSDDYPVYPTYVYLVDNVVIRSETKTTVAELKKQKGAREVRNVAIFDHSGLEVGDRIEP